MDTNENIQQTDIPPFGSPTADAAVSEEGSTQLSAAELAIQLEEANKRNMSLSEQFDHLSTKTQTLEKLEEMKLSKELLPYVMGKTPEETSEKIAGLHEVLNNELTRMVKEKLSGYSPAAGIITEPRDDTDIAFENALKGR